MIIFRNDEVAAALGNLGVEQGGFQPMNRMISRTLYDLVAPSHRTGRIQDAKLRPNQRAFRMRSFVADVAPVPSNKLVELWSTAGLPRIHRKDQDCSQLGNVRRRWGTEVDHLSKFIARYDLKSDEQFKCVSFQVSVRSAIGNTKFPKNEILALRSRVAHQFSCVPWNKCTSAVRCLQGTASRLGEPTMCLALNRTALPGYLERVAQKARVMFDVGAYKHWWTFQNFPSAFI
mmetsp:Transcript_31301/g.60427  ORF Transcript_31301/g.60427 Transcript_31301/m.60427 type:complete len:232 (+) Transcript_31301:854-1549(+)